MVWMDTTGRVVKTWLLVSISTATPVNILSPRAVHLTDPRKSAVSVLVNTPSMKRAQRQMFPVFVFVRRNGAEPSLEPLLDRTAQLSLRILKLRQREIRPHSFTMMLLEYMPSSPSIRISATNRYSPALVGVYAQISPVLSVPAISVHSAFGVARLCHFELTTA